MKLHKFLKRRRKMSEEIKNEEVKEEEVVETAEEVAETAPEK